MAQIPTTSTNDAAATVANGAASAEANKDPYEDVTQATVPSGLTLVPKRVLKALHLG
jgi:hypothetical protein